MRHDAAHTIDVHLAAEGMSVLLVVSVLIQPLILAHASVRNEEDGSGLAPVTLRPLAMKRVQQLASDLFCSAKVYAFMVGEYDKGSRLFVAPIDYACTTARNCLTHRGRAAIASKPRRVLVWCTLAALAGSMLWDASARCLFAT